MERVLINKYNFKTDWSTIIVVNTFYIKYFEFNIYYIDIKK